MESIDATSLWQEFYRNRSVDTRNKIVTCYTTLVKFVVNRLGIPTTSLLDSDDLVGYGTIGLINAIERFDSSRGVHFEAFATPRIRGAIIDQLRVLNWLPRSAVSHAREIEHMIAALEQKLGRLPSEEEAAKELGVTIERYRHILTEVGHIILSLDAPIHSRHEDGPMSLSDVLEDHAIEDPSTVLEQKELLKELADVLQELPVRERELLSHYYQQEYTMKEISQLMHVSESRVCQLHAQAVQRLQKNLQRRHYQMSLQTNEKHIIRKKRVAKIKLTLA